MAQRDVHLPSGTGGDDSDPRGCVAHPTDSDSGRASHI